MILKRTKTWINECMLVWREHEFSYFFFIEICHCRNIKEMKN